MKTRFQIFEKIIFSNKADIGWSFIVKMLIGLMLLFALIVIAVGAKKGFSNMFSGLTNLFG